MLWILFFLWTHKEKVTDSARLRVECATCGTRFSYLMTRTGTASETFFGPVAHRFKERVYEEAEEDLEYLLEEDFDCVPCPGCGDYQPEMADRLKQQRYARLLVSRTALLILAGIGLLGCLYFGRDAIERYEGEGDSYKMFVVLTIAMCTLVVVASLGTWLGTRLLYTHLTSAYDANNADEFHNRIVHARERTAIIVGKPLAIRARLVDE